MSARRVLAALGAGIAATTSALALAQDQPVGAQPDARTSFAVFRRLARPGDQMPPGVRAQLAPVAAREGADIDAARAVAPAGRAAVWAIPGDGVVCLAIPDPVDGFAVNCADRHAALSGRLWVGLVGLPGQRAGDARIAVLVPDGVDDVSAVDAHEGRHALPVAGNVAFGDVTDSAGVEYRDGDGVHSVAVPGTPSALVSSSSG